MSDRLRLVSDRPRETALLLLKRYRSVQLCRRMLARRVEPEIPPPSEELLNRKAEGVASAVETALGYLLSAGSHLNSRILTSYYGMLQLTIAEQVASLCTDADLQKVQSKTMGGHGLYNFSLEPGEFPDNFAVALGTNGHFASYLKFLGIDVKDYALAKNPRGTLATNTHDALRAVRIVDLFRRIPELRPIVAEHLGKRPLSFHVGHDDKNLIIQSEAVSKYYEEHGRPPPPLFGFEDELKDIYISIYSSNDLEYVQGLDMRPIKDIELRTPTTGLGDDPPYLRGVIRAKPFEWHQSLHVYKSRGCGSSFVVPIIGTQDPYLMHVMLLYGLSILVRYLPDLWRKVASGEYDHFRSLIEFYLDVFDNEIPLQAVERITGQDVMISQPEGFNAPV